ncbi:TPM domain-containing protein [Niabella hirudinis]|uniref:TPM domain-containing protein n=1 Tax=Niabella hirudinis TaxID=1285929 RepID=UPI003EB81B7C
MTHLKLAALFLTLLFFINAPALAQKRWTVKAVPDPRAQPGFNYVSNPDGVLSGGTVAEINADLKQLEEATTDQVAVVVLNSIGKKVPRDFAMELLRHWGVGQKEKNNGVLVLLVMDQRRMEFEVGYGLEGTLTDLVSKQIQEDYMVPYAKQGNYDAAVLKGVKQVAQLLSGNTGTGGGGGNTSGALSFPPDAPASEPSYGNTITSPVSRSFPENIFALYKQHVGWGGFWVLLFYVIYLIVWFTRRFKAKDQQNFFYSARPGWLSAIQFLCCYAGLPFLLFFIFTIPINIFTGLVFFYLFGISYLGLTVLGLLRCLRAEEEKRTEDDLLYLYVRQLDQHWKGTAADKLFPFPLLYFRARIGQYLARLRNGMLISNAGNEMRLLDEKQDNTYLTKAQKMEERLQSVDYDVWAEQGGKAFKLHGVLLSSKYSHCPKCNTMAYYLESDRTIEPATYSSSGVGLKVYTCKFCHHREQKEYRIPQKSRPSDSSSSGSGSSSSSGSSGSWGGGSSGGGGAGSSW